MLDVQIEWNLAFAHGAVLLLGVILYALLGGADFGGGVWDLLAHGPRAERQREAIAKAIGPVWEANHVWLIFVVVVTFTAFPPVYSALSSALYVVFTLALLGIVFRGAAFIFRAHARDVHWANIAWGRVFAGASVITPVLFGMAAGAVASGDIRVIDGHVSGGYWSTWLAPFPAVIGLLALSICAYLAAVYLTLETESDLQEDFRRKALRAGAVFTGLAMLALSMARWEAPVVWDGLVDESALLIPLTLGTAGLSGWAVKRRRYQIARVTAAIAVAVMLAGWSLAQYPYLVVPDLDFDTSAAPDATLKMLLVVLGAGSVILLPSLWFLFSVFKRETFTDETTSSPSPNIGPLASASSEH